MTYNIIMKNTEELTPEVTSKLSWIEKALFRSQNKKWLSYSSKIALMILSALEERNLNQKQLAEQAEVTQQQISKIIKGQENLTLKSIAKLSEILGAELITFPLHKYNSEPLDYVFIVQSDHSISTSNTYFTGRPDNVVVMSGLISEQIVATKIVYS